MKFAAARILALLALGLFPVMASAQPGATSSLGFFPKLPPSVLCKKELLPGTWKLVTVYEAPSGPEMALYTVRPLQYYVFTASGLYGTYIAPLRALTHDEARLAALNDTKVPQQYVVNKSGMLFFYKDSIAIDSLACFIVAQDMGAFARGQMLLMPPQRSCPGRLLFQRLLRRRWIWFQRPSAAIRAWGSAGA